MCQVALALIPRDAIEGGPVVSSQLAAQPDDPCIVYDHALFLCVGHPLWAQQCARLGILVALTYIQDRLR